MRYWEGQADVNCLNQSKNTQSGVKSGYRPSQNFPPVMTPKWVVVTILLTKLQSQPCMTIHHTNDETLGGSS